MFDEKFPSQRTVPVVIPANGETTLSISGSFVRCLSATGAFKLSADDSREYIDMEAGIASEAPDGYKFKELVFRNESGVAITAKVFVGTGRLHDSRLSLSANAGSISVQNAANTKLLVQPNVSNYGSGVYALTNAATVKIHYYAAGVNGIIFQNTGNGDIYFANVNNIATIMAQGIKLAPNEKIVLDGSANLWAVSAGATGEIRYLTMYGV